jgi:hypothetical protein
MTVRNIWGGLIRRLASWAKRNSAGIAAVEFAMLAPIMITLFIGVIDGARAMLAEMQLSAAVSAGAQYVVNSTTSITQTGGSTDLATSIANIVGNVNGTGWASGTVVVNNGFSSTFSGGTPTTSGSASTSCYCPTGSPGSWTWSAAANCAASCSPGIAGMFVTIAASRAFTPMFSSFGFLPSTLYQYAVVQVQ